VIIGLTALAAAAGLNRPASGFHADAIRIPMMAICSSRLSRKSICDLEDSYPALPAISSVAHNSGYTEAEAREVFQIVLALLTLVLVAPNGNPSGRA